MTENQYIQLKLYLALEIENAVLRLREANDDGYVCELQRSLVKQEHKTHRALVSEFDAKLVVEERENNTPRDAKELLFRQFLEDKGYTERDAKLVKIGQQFWDAAWEAQQEKIDKL